MTENKLYSFVFFSSSELVTLFKYLFDFVFIR